MNFLRLKTSLYSPESLLVHGVICFEAMGGNNIYLSKQFQALFLHVYGWFLKEKALSFSEEFLLSQLSCPVLLLLESYSPPPTPHLTERQKEAQKDYLAICGWVLPLPLRHQLMFQSSNSILAPKAQITHWQLARVYQAYIINWEL